MPMYFFDVQLSDGVITDDTIGTELDDHAAARKEAEQALVEMARDVPFHQADTDTEIKISVRDEAGSVVGVRTARLSSEDFET